MIKMKMEGLIMVIVQVANTGLNVCYKMASNDGMSLTVMVAYRFLFASAFMLPFALFLERKIRPKLTWTVVLQAFFCGLLGGSLAQNLYAKTLALTSATFASAMANLIPVITFVMAVSFGLETLGLRTIQGKAKVVGTLGSIGGALLLTLYKGPHIDFWSTHVDLLPKGPHSHGHVADSHQFLGQQMWGALLAVLCCCSCALSLIIQAKLSEGYPCCYSSTALVVVMGSVQAVVFALIAERDWNQWKLGWNIRLLSVAYSGIIASGVMFILVMWCIKRKGPLFVSIFTPLMLVFTAIAGSLLLEEKLHLGSVLGAVLIVSGLYGVLWAKGKETEKSAPPPLLIPLRRSPEFQRMDIPIPTSTENSSIATNPTSTSSSSSSNAIVVSNATARADI